MFGNQKLKGKKALTTHHATRGVLEKYKFSFLQNPQGLDRYQRKFTFPSYTTRLLTPAGYRLKPL